MIGWINTKIFSIFVELIGPAEDALGWFYLGLDFGPMSQCRGEIKKHFETLPKDALH